MNIWIVRSKNDCFKCHSICWIVSILKRNQTEIQRSRVDAPIFLLLISLFLFRLFVLFYFLFFSLKTLFVRRFIRLSDNTQVYISILIVSKLFLYLFTSVCWVTEFSTFFVARVQDINSSKDEQVGWVLFDRKIHR